MPATHTFVRNLLLAKAYVWAWSAPDIFEKLVQEDDNILGAAVSAFRLAPDDLCPDNTITCMQKAYDALSKNSCSLKELCADFDTSESLQMHRAIGLLVVGKLLPSFSDKKTKLVLAENHTQVWLDFHKNAYAAFYTAKAC
jgi:hypothetical protein